MTQNIHITKAFIDRLTPPPPRENGTTNQAFYRDAVTSGFGLRISSGGTRSFIVEKRINGKVRRLTLGKYGDLTVDQARKEAMHFLGDVANGKNPVTAKINRRIRNTTLRQAFDDYLRSRKDLKPATIQDYRRAINGPLRNWQSKLLTDISKDMVQLRHAALGKRSKARANNTMRVLRAVFNHAIAKYEDNYGAQPVLSNPVIRLNQTRAWFNLKPRQRFIAPDQLPDWFAASMQLSNETSRHYLYVLLFTGLRRSQASCLQWTDVDLENRQLSISAGPNKQAYALPLSDFLYELLKKRQAASDSLNIFPSASATGGPGRS